MHVFGCQQERHRHPQEMLQGTVISAVIEIKMKKGEPVERALRRLKKVLDKEGMMKQLRANRYFEKPSEKRRRKSARARSRMLSGR